ncbi:MAG: hypothetical protein WDN28_06045 [Chthoniobacter sp.]
MTNFTPEEHAWASQAAMRLRFVQADFSDRPAEERRSFLNDEVESALRNVVPEKRGRYVQALAEHFPTGFVRHTPAVDATPADNSPEALVDALVKIAPDLPKRLLAAFGLRLQEAGYMEIKSTILMDEPPEELRRSIPLDPKKPVDLQRMYRALAIFADYYIGLETIIWHTWKELAPNSLFRREGGAAGDVKRTAARYLQADSEVSAEQLRQIVEKTRKLMGGLLGGIPSGGTAFLDHFHSEFTPENIASQAKGDKSLGGWTEDAKNWNKYKKMFEDQQAQVLREKMFEAIAKKAEALMTGTHRKET